MGGWFDAFRTEGGPTLYSYSNRTPVTGDPPSIALYVIFATLAIAFLIIFPGIRKERFSTFCSVTLSLFVGSAILLSKYGSAWHVAESPVTTDYRAFSRERVSAHIGVHVGLTHFNVTLQGMPSWNESTVSVEDIDFNERFYWVGASQIQEELRSALQRGLPYPILTVVEYFSLDDEGFCWGRKYRQAGYFAGILLWASFASWLLMNLLVVVVPRYGAYQMVLTGGLLLLTDLVYFFHLPARALLIRFEEHVLVFRLGSSFWLILAAGGSCVTSGGLIAIIDLVFPHKFSTILEVDYDTPYDRHIIIEDSHDSKKKKGKRSLEEPDGIGRKILRTLSKRGSSNEGLDVRLANQLQGHPNEAFQMDPPAPNSPWSHPHHHLPKETTHQLRGALASAFAKNPALLRLAAPNHPRSPKAVEDRRKDSSSSSDVPHEPISFQSQFRGVERRSSRESISSASSFGLRLLSRQESQNKMHQPASRRKSSPRHLPLHRIHYTDHRHIELPRATLDRKPSGEEEVRRDSASSATTHDSHASSTTNNSVLRDKIRESQRRRRDW